MKLRTKTSIYLSCLIIILISLTTGFFINKFNTGLYEFLNTRGKEFVELLAEDIEVAILVNDITTIKEFVMHRIRRPDVLFIRVKDKDEKLIFQHKNEFADVTKYLSFSAPVLWEEGTGMFEDNENLLFEDSLLQTKQIKSQSEQIGTVDIGLSLNSINDKRDKIIKATILIAGIMIAISFGITFSLIKKIVHPIESISQISGKIASGDYANRVTLEAGDDEIGTMVNAFNTMAEALQSYTEKLESKVDERTHELKQAHKELENKAFFAGMAEIARGALHDVNNAMQGLHSNLTNLDISIEDIDLDSFKNIASYFKSISQPDNDKKWNDVLFFFDEANELFIKEKNDARKALSECNRIVSHINKLISAQQRHAKSGTTKELLDINTVLMESVNIYRQSMEKRNIKLDLKLSDNKLPGLYLSEGELERFFGNFIKNSIDAMDEEPGRENKFLIETMLVDHKINVRFKDTGGGINKSDLPNIFRPDFTTKKTGTGFGLSFCLDFMKQNDGQIHVKTSNEGTDFLLIFS